MASYVLQVSRQGKGLDGWLETRQEPLTSKPYDLIAAAALEYTTDNVNIGDIEHVWGGTAMRWTSSDGVTIVVATALSEEEWQHS